ncbi:MAG: hypothetical protein EOL97_15905 [Spirochaetia bacterium]|nr:hypothetical protein [Spirochaetia bacterium]
MASNIVAKTGLTQLKKYETTLLAGFDEITLSFIQVPISQQNMLVFRNGLLNTLGADYTYDEESKIIVFTEIFDTNSIITVLWNVSIGDIPSYPTNFWELSDTPLNYTGKEGQYVKVNSSANGLEFVTLPVVPIATTDTTGIVKIGDGILVDETGTIKIDDNYITSLIIALS